METKKIATNILYIIMLILFTITILFILLDTIGLLGSPTISGVLGAINSNITKITLMILCLIGSTIILEKMLVIDRIDKNTEKLNKIEPMIESIHNATSEIVVLNNRKDIYKALAAEIEKARENACVCVTSFEKLRSVPYDKGDEVHETTFMQNWFEYVKNGKFTVKQLVHVFSDYDLQEVEKRLSDFRDRPNYSLNVIFSPPVKNFFDLFIIRDSCLFITIPTESASPFAMDMAFLIYDKEMVKYFELFFNVMWSNSLYTKSLKNRDGIIAANVEFLKKIVPQEDSKIDSDTIPKFILKLSRYEKFYYLFDNILEDLSKTENYPIKQQLEDIFHNILTESREKAVNIFRGFVDLSSDAGQIILAELFNSANKEVKAVSYDFQGERFWNTKLGRELLNLNITAIDKKVKIERVFIVDPKSTELEEIRTMLKDQINHGIDVYVTEINKIEESYMLDFLIMDDSVVFHIIDSERHDLVRKSRVTLSKQICLDFLSKYKHIKTKGIKAEKYLKGRN